MHTLSRQKRPVCWELGKNAGSRPCMTTGAHGRSILFHFAEFLINGGTWVWQILTRNWLSIRFEAVRAGRARTGGLRGRRGSLTLAWTFAKSESPSGAYHLCGVLRRQTLQRAQTRTRRYRASSTTLNSSDIDKDT